MVLIVVGILLGVAYPGGMYLVETNRQATEVNQLLVTIQRARQQSINAQRTLVLGHGGDCSSLESSGTADWSLCYQQGSALGEVIYRRNEGQKYSVKSTKESIVFRPPPLTAEKSVFILIETGFNVAQPRIVKISRTGRPQVLSCSENGVPEALCDL